MPVSLPFSSGITLKKWVHALFNFLVTDGKKAKWWYWNDGPLESRCCSGEKAVGSGHRKTLAICSGHRKTLAIYSGHGHWKTLAIYSGHGHWKTLAIYSGHGHWKTLAIFHRGAAIDQKKGCTSWKDIIVEYCRQNKRSCGQECGSNLVGSIRISNFPRGIRVPVIGKKNYAVKFKSNWPECTTFVYRYLCFFINNKTGWNGKLPWSIKFC